MAGVEGPRIDPNEGLPGVIISPAVEPRTLPDWILPDPRGLDNVSSTVSERSLTVARVGADIPIIYGRDIAGAKIYRAKTYGGKLIVVCVWCEGEIEAVESITVNGAAFTGTATHYTGTSSQTGDSLVATVWGQADDLADIAYSVISLPAESGLQIEAVIQGRKVYDPRGPLIAYSTNAALCGADYMDTQSDRSPNWASVGVSADYCDEIITGTTKRWEIGLTVTRGKVNDWISALKEYANVFLYRDDGEVYFLPDEARAVDHTLTGTDIKNLRLRKLGQRDTPTQVFCDYTLPTDNEWQSREEYTPDPAASVPLRVTRLRMPGYFRAIHAYRKAVETLNRATLEDLEATFDVFDDGVKITRGDVLSITHPRGLSNKQFRVHDIDPLPRGRWRLICREYDVAVYSGAIVSDPSTEDTGLANRVEIPDGPTPTVTDKNYTDEMGNTYSILSIDFTGVDWAWSAGYRIKVSAGSFVTLETTVAHQGVVTHTVPTPAVTQGTTYTIEVWVLNGLGGMSTLPGTATKQADGKSLPPSDVDPSSLVGVEASLFVSLQWAAASDTDLKGYIIKRLSKADWDGESTDDARWTHANVVTVYSRNDATSALLPNQPVGDFYYGVKAIDKVYPKAGHESVTAAWTFVPVTADNAGAVALKQLSVAYTGWTWDSTDITFDGTDWDFSGAEYTVGSLTNMHIYEIYGDGVFAVTSTGRTWSTRFGGAATSWDTNVSAGEKWFGDLNVASEMFTEIWDTGSDRTASWNWLGEIEHEGGGTLSQYVGLAKDATPDTWVDHAGNAVNAEGRYMRAVVKLTADLGNGFRIRLPINATYQGKIQEFSGQETLLSTGQPTTVTFATSYGGTPKITLQLVGSTPGFALADNITVDDFEIRVWDTSGVAMAGTVDWQSIGT